MQYSPRDTISYNVNDACAATGLSRTKIYSLISRGCLETVKVDGRTLIPAASLQALIMGSADQ